MRFECIEMKNLILAVVCSVLSVFLGLYIPDLIESSFHSEKKGVDVSSIVIAFAVIITFLFIIFYALPIHFLLKKLKKYRLGYYLLAAIIPSVAFAGLCWLDDKSLSMPVLMGLSLYCAILSATVFWYFAVYRKHKKQI